ncbi:hypothetical protein Bateq7PJ16_1181 [Bacillus subtilis]|uniref:Uncharacterized protein n=1 Tax=Bacillus subtilis TaxID=1423 RepID=A0AAP1H9V1_BACIU|nr:hypothetical protein BSSC8_32680 [Bacillus subtilis subsp. subtilis str. SC-8]KZD94811.1 hypothetical protein B4122_0568 [Bacillus subtilis]QHF56987.1 hypothetical protein Bateq7PJ16_1181 [Bacillus subtilis]GAK79892.1 hypothetical protein BSMD_018000 [Bacillus subtilis Miyagi-4]
MLYQLQSPHLPTKGELLSLLFFTFWAAAPSIHYYYIKQRKAAITC